MILNQSLIQNLNPCIESVSHDSNQHVKEDNEQNTDCQDEESPEDLVLSAFFSFCSRRKLTNVLLSNNNVPHVSNCTPLRVIRINIIWLSFIKLNLILTNKIKGNTQWVNENATIEDEPSNVINDTLDHAD